MINLQVQPHGAKHVRVSGINLFLAEFLQELPQVLERRDTPDASNRLFPSPTPGDDKAGAEWRQMVVPELRHLFVSAGEVVTRDLTAMAPESPESNCLQVTIPVEHVNAWMSALNQARLILAEVFKVDEQDMAARGMELHTPKQTAVLKIHVLGYLLQLFVELQSGNEPESSI